MSKPILYAVTFVVCFLLQVAVSPAISIGGCSPNFLYIPVLVVALYSGASAGGAAGFILGLIFDLMTSGVVGCMGLVLTVVGMIVGALASGDDMRSPAMACIVAVLAVFLSELSYGIVVMLTNTEATGAFVTLAAHSLPQGLYSSIFACIALVIMGLVVVDEASLGSQGRIGTSPGGNPARLSNMRSRFK